MKEGDKNPKALAGTEDEELGGIVLRPVKPRILPKFQHSLHNDQAEPCCPDVIIKFAERTGSSRTGAPRTGALRQKTGGLGF